MYEGIREEIDFLTRGSSLRGFELLGVDCITLKLAEWLRVVTSFFLTVGQHKRNGQTTFHLTRRKHQP